jgi:hypothetical protein
VLGDKGEVDDLICRRDADIGFVTKPARDA